MKFIYFNKVEWDGNQIRLILSSKQDLHGTWEMSVWNRKSKQIKIFDYFITKDDKLTIFHIDTNQFRNLKMGNWDFYIKPPKKNDWKKISLKVPTTLSQQQRYFEPIVSMTSSRYVCLNLTNSNALSIHCSSKDKLEEKVYNIINYNKQIHHIEENKEFLIFYVDLSSYMSSDFEVVVRNEFHETYKLLFSANETELHLYKKQFEKFKGNWFISIQLKKNKVLERTNFYVDEAKFQEENFLKNTKFEYVQVVDGTILLIEQKDPFRPTKILYGELNVEDVTVRDNRIFFSLSSDDNANVKDWNFFLERNKNDEKLYLQKNFDNLNGENTFYIDQDQLELIASKNLSWNLYAEKRHDDYLEVRRVGDYYSTYTGDLKRYKGFIKLTDQLCAVPFISKSQAIRIVFMSVDQYYKHTSPAEISIKSLTVKKHILNISIKLGLSNKQSFKFLGIQLVQRKEPKGVINLPLKNLIQKRGNKVIVTSCVDLSRYEFIPFYWDFFAVILVNGNEKRKIRLYSDNYLVIKKLRHLMFKYNYLDSNEYVTYPYLTVNGGLSITRRKKGDYENRINKINEYSAYVFYHLFYKYLLNEPVWLVHEKYSETAQDNGFYFFKYSYEYHYQRKVYYVIKKGTEDERNLENYKDRVVYFMSFKHLVLLISSRVIISSEAKGHGYAWRVSQGVIRDYLNSKKFVFLQHGVLGLKKVDSTFDYNTQNSAELFVASSEFEKRIIKKYFGYKDDRVVVTGLPRWDVLDDKTADHISDRKEILLMPTWRNWLDEVEKEEFIESDYYKAYNQLLHSEYLSKFLENNSLLLNFYVHPKFMPYVSSFTKSNEHIKIIQFGEAKVNELLMRSSLLITDYSSVSWEMYYQKKPVVFYHFDVAQYMTYQGSYMDLKKDLFGDVATNPEDLVNVISGIAEKGFKEDQKFINKRGSYFKFIDKKNSERIFNEIVLKEKEINKKQSLLKSIKELDLVKVLWRKYKNIDIIQRYGKKIILKLKQ